MPALLTVLYVSYLRVLIEGVATVMLTARCPKSANDTQYSLIPVLIRNRKPRQFPRPALPLRCEA